MVSQRMWRARCGLLLYQMLSVVGLRVMTWNLWNERVSSVSWEKRLEGVRAHIRTIDPEILSVQECTERMREDLMDMFPYATEYQESDAKTKEGLVMFSVYPIESNSKLVEIPRQPGSDQNERAFLRSKVSLPNGVIDIGTVHLSYEPSQGMAQWNWLMQNWRPTLMMGDLNVYKEDFPDWEERMTETGYLNLKEQATWSTTAHSKPTNPADQILVRFDSEWCVVSVRRIASRIGNVHSSDHYAVVADLKKKNSSRCRDEG